jgi:hypothetical protein
MGVARSCPEHGYRHDHGEGRPGIDAKQAGRSERVVRHSLHDRARHRQRGAGQKPGQHAWQAQRRHHQMLARAIERKERRKHIRNRNVRRAERHGPDRQARRGKTQRRER